MKTRKAIVIGSGFGGLALAIRLQSQGFKTTIIEKRDKPGGRAYVYKDNGFTFDAGPTVVTAPHCLEELFECCGKDIKDYVTLKSVLPFYRLAFPDGTQFDYSNDDKAMEEQITALNPDDWKGYKKFLNYSKEVFKEGYEGLVDVAFPSFWSMIRVAPQLARLQAFRSVYSMVKSFIKDDRLRQAFSFHSLLVGGNPFSSSSIYTLIHHLERKWGVYFPIGGTGALVNALVKLYEEEGGRILYNAPVDEICTENGKTTGVRLENGQFLDSDLVASNADVNYTYTKMLRNEKKVKWTKKKLELSNYSMSLFLVYFGVKKKYPDMAHHTVIFGPRYKGLLNDIFKKGKLADDFSLYLHMPTKTDPGLAPEGCEGFYVLSPVPHLGKANLDWDMVGPKYADRILDFLDEKYLPGLRENLVTQRIVTPKDFKTELYAHEGSAFSLEPILTQSAYFRAQNRDKNIKGLYTVGAGTHPGAGIPGVVNSGKATFGVIHEVSTTVEESGT